MGHSMYVHLQVVVYLFRMWAGGKVLEQYEFITVGFIPVPTLYVGLQGTVCVHS